MRLFTLPSVQSENEFHDIASWRGLDQQYAYPFDIYYLESGLLALHRDTNASVPILDIDPVDSVANFAVPQIQHTHGIDVLSPTDNATVVAARYFTIRVQRNLLTKFFVMMLSIVNRALTGTVLYIIVAVDHGKAMNSPILVLPLGVVLTIPALRVLWLGAPGFSILLGMHLVLKLQTCC
jgi:hypothetical protein